LEHSEAVFCGPDHALTRRFHRQYTAFEEVAMRVLLLGVLVSGLTMAGCPAGPETVKKEEKMETKVEGTAEVEAKLKAFIEKHVARVAPLEIEQNLAFWDATTTGKKESYELSSQKELEIRKVYSDAETFKLLKEIKAGGKVKDPLLQRQLTVLYLAFEENQVPAELLTKMVKLSTEIQKMFNDYRGSVGGKQVTDNDIYDILKSSADSKKRRDAWEAYKQRGSLVRDKVLELVRLRNRAAKHLGYDNFYEMRLQLIEQDPEKIRSIFDDLAKQTDQPFKELMGRINQKLASRYRVKPEELRPWHYEDPFFQEAPAIGKLELDPLFSKSDPRVLVNGFFKGIDLDPADILDRSDLYEKKGKMPHAYCIHIDRKGDVRILSNLRNSERWTSTLMHEMGHAVYDKYINQELPWLLREPSHSFATEAVAELFGRLTRNPHWLGKMLKLPEEKIGKVADDIRLQLRMTMLIMARWTMVMVNFERELYKNPDQDLNKLWWGLKQRYQLLSPPEGRNAPDWASKIHIACWPAYYHNYMLGELMASQILDHMSKTVLKTDDPVGIDGVERAELGRYLREKIFKPGKSLRWDQLLIQATGESLNPKYFAEQFVK
jgi:peptidyl-dipeptidase A